MKKTVSLILTSVLLISLVLISGCSKSTNNQQQSMQNDHEKNESMKLSFIGASATGPVSMIMNGLSECVNKSFPDSVVTISPGNLGTNVTRINKNEGDVAISDTFFVLSAIGGKAPFNEKLDNLAYVASLYPSSVHLIVDKKVGIDSFDQFITQKMKLRISPGQAGGASDIFFQQLLAEYGLSVADVENWGGEVLNQNISDSVQMLTDGRIDFMVMSNFIPTPNIQELSKNKDIVFLKIEPNVMESLCEKYGYYPAAFPVGAYDPITEELPCLNVDVIFIVPQNSPNEIAYSLVQAINENLDYLQAVHSILSNLNSNDLVNNQGIPLHPGAEQYYREKGILP